MNRAISEELSLFEARAHAEDLPRPTSTEPSLETDEIPHLARFVFPAELDHSVRSLTCPWVGEPDRLHRSIAEGILTPLCDHIDRETPLEIRDHRVVHAGRGLSRGLLTIDDDSLPIPVRVDIRLP